VLEEHLGVLLVREHRLGREAVERVERCEAFRDLERREREARHLLAHGDAVLVEAVLLVAVHGLEVARCASTALPFL
jgi:hypothetical protein